MNSKSKKLVAYFYRRTISKHIRTSLNLEYKESCTSSIFQSLTEGKHSRRSRLHFEILSILYKSVLGVPF